MTSGHRPVGRTRDGGPAPLRSTTAAGAGIADNRAAELEAVRGGVGHPGGLRRRVAALVGEGAVSRDGVLATPEQKDDGKEHHQTRGSFPRNRGGPFSGTVDRRPTMRWQDQLLEGDEVVGAIRNSR
jgi:hypothetical protein